MGEDSIGLNIDGVGKKVRTNSRVVGADTVHEEVFIVTDGAGNIVDPRKNLDVTGSVLPTGASTEATLGTVHGHVDSIDGKVTACNTGAVVLTTGTASIGKLASNTGVDIGDVDVLSLPSHTLPTGYGTVRVDTDADADLVAADGTKTIYVLGYQLQGKGDVQVTLRDGIAAADIGPEWDFNAREGVVAPIKEWPYYYFKTAASGKLSIDVDAGIFVTGNIQYVQV